jgi:D-alanyl-D-alanine carboxypeptidase
MTYPGFKKAQIAALTVWVAVFSLALPLSASAATAVPTKTLTSVSNPQTAATRHLDDYFDLLSKNNQFKGAVAITEGGKAVYQRSVDNPPQTRLRMGSISKVFTAVLTFKAIEAGLFTLDTPLASDFPDIPSKAITVSDLLNHRSGLNNFTSAPDYSDYMSQPQSRAQMRRRIFAAPLVFPPGSKAEYSNSNYVLLTLLLEKRTGKSYSDLLQAQIIEPLQLQQTAYGDTIQPPRDAHSYQWSGESWVQQPQTDMSIPLGAGALVSTPEDLNAFFRALFQGQLLSKASLAQMTTLQEGYGRGIFAVPFGQLNGWGHTGGIDAFTASSAYFPARDLAFTVMSNGNRLALNDISKALMSLYEGLPFDSPDFSVRPIKVSSDVLQKYAGTYAAEGVPLKIVLRVVDGALQVQATGQQAILMTPYPGREFRFAPANLRLVFDPEKPVFVLHQGGGQYLFQRQSQP